MDHEQEAGNNIAIVGSCSTVCWFGSFPLLNNFEIILDPCGVVCGLLCEDKPIYHTEEELGRETPKIQNTLEVTTLPKQR